MSFPITLRHVSHENHDFHGATITYFFVSVLTKRNQFTFEFRMIGYNNYRILFAMLVFVLFICGYKSKLRNQINNTFRCRLKHQIEIALRYK